MCVNVCEWMKTFVRIIVKWHAVRMFIAQASPSFHSAWISERFEMHQRQHFTIQRHTESKSQRWIFRFSWFVHMYTVHLRVFCSQIVHLLWKKKLSLVNTGDRIRHRACIHIATCIAWIRSNKSVRIKWHSWSSPCFAQYHFVWLTQQFASFISWNKILLSNNSAANKAMWQKNYGTLRNSMLAMEEINRSRIRCAADANSDLLKGVSRTTRLLMFYRSSVCSFVQRIHLFMCAYLLFQEDNKW